MGTEMFEIFKNLRKKEIDIHRETKSADEEVDEIIEWR